MSRLLGLLLWLEWQTSDCRVARQPGHLHPTWYKKHLEDQERAQAGGTGGTASDTGQIPTAERVEAESEANSAIKGGSTVQPPQALEHAEAAVASGSDAATSSLAGGPNFSNSPLAEAPVDTSPLKISEKYGSASSSSPLKRAKPVLFSTHHKTGTVLLNNAVSCLKAHVPDLITEHSHTTIGHNQGELSAADLSGYSHVIHFVRNPRSIVMSEYFYHRDVGEDWTNAPGSAKVQTSNEACLGRNLARPHGTESWTEYLRRNDELTGLHASLCAYSLHRQNELQISHDACSTASNCQEFCLEWFTLSSAAYESRWHDVLNWVGVENVPKELMGCLTQSDTNGPNFRTNHSTRNRTVSMEERIRRTVEQLDWLFNEASLAVLGNRLPC